MYKSLRRHFGLLAQHLLSERGGEEVCPRNPYAEGRLILENLRNPAYLLLRIPKKIRKRIAAGEGLSAIKEQDL